jgi:soluble lytic murein transglycosylase
MQVKPALAKFIATGAGVPYKGSGCLSEPEKNIRLGAYHLSKLMEDFQDLGVALHAYNTGPAKAKIGVQNRVSKEKGPTNRFAKHVLKEYRKNIEVLPDVE